MAATAEVVSQEVKPARRVRGPRKSTIAALDAARREGYEMGKVEGARAAAPPMLATAVVWCAGVAFGAIVGAWLF